VTASGDACGAYQAFSAAPNGHGVVILPDVHGLHPYYEDLARRFAEIGFAAVAIDYYGRTAGTASRNLAFNWRDHVPYVVPEHVEADVASAVSVLRGRRIGPVFTVGFCFGGGHSWRLAASGLDLAGAIGFYGLPFLVHDVVADVSTPLLMLLAGEDDETPREEYRCLIARLDAWARPTTHTHTRTPHTHSSIAPRPHGRTCAQTPGAASSTSPKTSGSRRRYRAH
jgi:carboxymethylenebutenolidase